MKDFEVCPGLVSKQQAYKMFADESRQMALYTPTGLDILTKVLNKDARASQLVQVNKLDKHIGKCFTFFRFLDLLVQCACIGLADTHML